MNRFSTFRRRPTHGAWGAVAFCLAAAIFVSVVLSRSAWAQRVNFTPLERGDFTEEEEELIMLRGIEASVDYAILLSDLNGDSVPGERSGSDIFQDIRLKLKTVFHRDIALHLVLEPQVQPVDDSNIRRQPTTSRRRLPEGQTTGINVREAYLRYAFNPNSGLLLGTHELSLGDRRGKTFNAIVPAVTYDCRVGTWCMPFGGAKINDEAEDWLYHWALEYTAWDGANDDGLREAFEVEIFRLIYTEKNVPLGRNLGPAVEPESPIVDDGTLIADDVGNPIYYDAHGTDWYGFRLNWEAGAFFFNFDLVAAQGSRIYHTYRSPETGIDAEMTFNNIDPIRRRRQKISGFVYESEIGYRTPGSVVGIRLLNATGDNPRPDTDGRPFLRGLEGYYEITPGSYQGNRLYFNGTDSQVDGGAGLGHSINNTRMIGFFWNIEDREDSQMGYSGGIYDLRFNKSVIDAVGKRREFIGLEIDNMLTFFLHKALRFQIEVNVIQQGPAFRFDDVSTPDNKKDLLVQGIGRLVYQF